MKRKLSRRMLAAHSYALSDISTEQIQLFNCYKYYDSQHEGENRFLTFDSSHIECVSLIHLVLLWLYFGCNALMTALTHCHSTGILLRYSHVCVFYFSFMSPATFYPCKSVTAYPINTFSPFKAMRLNWKLEDHMGMWVVKFREKQYFRITTIAYFGSNK